MKIFLDTASLKEIRDGAALGLVDGVTTNPTLLSKESGEPEEILREICLTVDGPISAEVVATDIVVKCPCTWDGLKATRALTTMGHRVNVTLVFSPTQALLAAKAGARFVSPFVGRLDDIATPGMELVADIVQILDNYDYDCEVLAASLRNPIHVVEAARVGAHIGTMPFAVFQSLVKHPLTDIGLKRFLEDWEKARKEMGAKAVP
jgi:transaldolase